MGIDVVALTEDDRDERDRYVSRSPHVSPFHRYAALEVLASYSETDLHTLVGYKGEDAIGLLSGVHQYKAKFDPEPKALFNVGWQSTKMKAISSLYNRSPKVIKSTGRN